MTDLKDYLLPTKKRVITFDDLETDEAIAFNWFYQQQKKYNTQNRLINNVNSFEELNYHYEDDGLWDYLKPTLGYQSDSNSLIEEILINCGITVENVFEELFTPLEVFTDDYENGHSNLEKKEINQIMEAVDNGYITLYETECEDVLKSFLDFYDKKNIKYQKCEGNSYYTDNYGNSKLVYYKLRGHGINSLIYYIASTNHFIDYVITEEGNYYIGFEICFDSDGYYDFNPLSTLVSLIIQDYISFDKEDLIDYDELFSSHTVNEFFNKIKIENTREVIF